MNFLYIAYAATWLIHITYLSVLVRRYQRLRHEIDELKRDRRAKQVEELKT